MNEHAETTPRARHRPPTPDEPRIPKWVERLAVPAWVSADRRIQFLNDRAAELLGVTADACRGVPCRAVVSARDELGTRFCAPHCPVVRAAQAGEEVQPVTLQVPGPKTTTRWIRLICIPLSMPGSSTPWLVHCAMPVDREHQIEAYLRAVANRTPRAPNEQARSLLTPRERQVFAGLARDEDLPTIATRLHISHETVRDHVQHILAALGAHSIPEAVASMLLTPPSTRR